MSDCRDYREILQGESLDSSDSSSDWEEISETLPSDETLGSGDTWSSSESSDSSQDSRLVSSENSQN